MAFNAPQITGTPYAGVVASNPPNFSYGTVVIGQINTTQANIGDQYLHIPSGSWYKLYLTGNIRSWVSQGGSSSGQVDQFTTSDSNVVTPTSGNVNFSQGNGVLTTGAGSTVTVSLSGTYSGAFSLTASSLTPLVLTSTASGAGAAPILSLYRNKTSSNADVIGEISFSGKNSTPAQATYCNEFVTIDSNTAASESASWRLQTASSGTLTNQIVALNTGCQIRGNNTNTTPPAGYIGQIIKSQVLQSSPISLTNSVQADLATISLTPGTWDLTLLVGFFGATVKSRCVIWIGTISADTTGVVGGYSLADSGYDVSVTKPFYLNIPRYRVSISSNTTYYASLLSVFTVGTETSWGTITAVRVG